jgi:DNA-binding response OmpR family regulator
MLLTGGEKMSEDKILVVDDDHEITKAIALLLQKEGLQTECAYNGMEALEKVTDPQVCLLIIDVMMPRLDGLSAVMRIREKRNLPILVLSAKSEDDYITKPFNPLELTARVKSHLRRYKTLGSRNEEMQRGILCTGRLAFDPAAKQLAADGEPVHLTATETKIVNLLMRNLGRVFSAEEIYRRVWHEDAYNVENTVMVHIRRIREKIELNPKEPEYLKVVWGLGYKMEKK